jgi:hypothetical protein
MDRQSAQCENDSLVASQPLQRRGMPLIDVGGSRAGGGEQEDDGHEDRVSLLIC